MSNTYFQFKQFLINQEKSGMKVTTDGCLFGAWIADKMMIGEPNCILDIGTGTGLLSLIMAQVTNESQIDAIEINRSSFEEAADNFSQSSWSNRLMPIHTSLQEFECTKKYELIICNPPFFQGNQQGLNLNKNQAVHNDSLSIKELLGGIKKLLLSNGQTFILLPEREMVRFVQIAREFDLFLNQEMIVRNKDQGDVFRIMASFSNFEAEIDHDEIIIRGQDNNYSQQFFKLLDPYYL